MNFGSDLAERDERSTDQLNERKEFLETGSRSMHCRSRALSLEWGWRRLQDIQAVDDLICASSAQIGSGNERIHGMFPMRTKSRFKDRNQPSEICFSSALLRPKRHGSNLTFSFWVRAPRIIITQDAHPFLGTRADRAVKFHLQSK